MTFQLGVFLYFYYAFLALWGVFVLISIYHMLKFGFKNFATFAAIVLFILISGGLLFASFVFISQIDWSINVTLFGSLGGADNILY